MDKKNNDAKYSNEVSITKRQKVDIRLKQGVGSFFTFNGIPDKKEHFAIGFGNWQKQETPWVRVHSECVTGDIFSSHLCDCGGQLEEAVERFQKTSGVLIYLRQEGRGIGLYNKLDAYALQSMGVDTFRANRMLGFPEDLRSYDICAKMLKALGLNQIRLLSNNPDKERQLNEAGIQVIQVAPTGVHLTSSNRAYLAAKVIHTNHTIQVGA